MRFLLVAFCFFLSFEVRAENVVLYIALNHEFRIPQELVEAHARTAGVERTLFFQTGLRSQAMFSLQDTTQNAQRLADLLTANMRITHLVISGYGATWNGVSGLSNLGYFEAHAGVSTGLATYFAPLVGRMARNARVFLEADSVFPEDPVKAGENAHALLRFLQIPNGMVYGSSTTGHYGPWETARLSNFKRVIKFIADRNVLLPVRERQRRIGGEGFLVTLADGVAIAHPSTKVAAIRDIFSVEQFCESSLF